EVRCRISPKRRRGFRALAHRSLHVFAMTSSASRVVPPSHSPSGEPEAGLVPDAQRLQAQLAAQAGMGSLEPLLQLLRKLLGARTVALVPKEGKESVAGVPVGGLGKLCEALDPAN